MHYIIEYIWLDSNKNFTSSINIINQLNIIPDLYYYKNIIKPCFVIKDYYNDSNSYLALCDIYDLNDNCISTRNGSDIFNIINYDKMQDDNEPYFIITQEYNVLYNTIYEKFIVEEHLKACLYGGLNITNITIGKFIIGPCYGINASDQFLMAKFLLEKIINYYNIKIIYKDISISFSSKESRKLNGIFFIYEYIKKLEFSTTKKIHLKIPIETLQNNCGYIEIYGLNNIDMYFITSLIYKICLL
jgi:hypothetical protein